MNLFSNFSFYLALAGFVLTAVYLKVVNEPPKPIHYIQEPSSSPYENSIAALGVVEALGGNIKVASPEEGIVRERFHSVGDPVAQGEALFQLDTDVLESELSLKTAQKEMDMANLNKQKAKLGRMVEGDPRAVSREEIQVLIDDVTIAETKIKVAEEQINHTKELIERKTVRAPMDGIILKFDVRVGEYVSKNESSVVLGSLGKFQIRVSIDEQNVGDFRNISRAVAFPKNNTSQQYELEFLRVEPFVIPKKSLTGVGKEIIDTRVLEVIYAIKPTAGQRVYVGQQMDVYIDKPYDFNESEDAQGVSHS